MRKLTAKQDHNLSFKNQSQTNVEMAQSGRFKDLLDIRTKAGHTPFFTAIIRGNLEIADILL
jgi:ankyrin repeat protein